ncbi:MAG: hypothetical protein HS115_00095 [Spirochaetales bacterium]|nr:hypothetical protein [Spirochaetales bacterium]
MAFGQVHLHSAASDGTILPEMLAELDFAALTDHDTFAGLDLFRDAPTQMIAGIELSVLYKGNKFHVVILEPRPSGDLFDLLRDLRYQREVKVQHFLRKMEAHGFRLSTFPFAWPGIHKRWLIEQLLRDPLNGELVERLGLQGPKDFKKRFVPDSLDFTPRGVALEQVRKSCNGIFILAHPGASLDLKVIENVQLVKEVCRTFGFHGLEVVTRRHSESDSHEARLIARELNLVAVTTNDVHAPQDLLSNCTSRMELDALYERSNCVRADWSILLHED